MKKTKEQRGITLVSLITTVIVLCILAATAIGTIQRDGLISKSQGASGMYNNALKDDEVFMQEGESILDEVLSGTNIGGGGSNGDNGGSNSGAAPENAFLWKSDDPSSPDYGVVIGYTENIQNYPTLRFPDRCTKIVIEFPENINGSIKSEMRSYAHNIKEIELPDTVTEIGAEAFWAYEFYNVEKITIPDSVTIIGDNAFSQCSSLTSITIPNSVTIIGDNAFSYCGFESIIISNSVTTIGVQAFAFCYNLESIIFNGTTEEWKQIEFGTRWNEEVLASYVQCLDGQIILKGITGREGEVVAYDSNNDGITEEWIILTDRNGLVEIVSKDVMGSLTLGYGDTSVTATTDLDGDGTVNDNGDKAILSYNNVITTINNYCKSLVTATDNEGVRSVGGTNNSFTAYSSTNYDNWGSKIAVDVASGDEYYQTDFYRMEELGIAVSNEKYWLASRYVYGLSSSVYFDVRYVDEGSLDHFYLWNVKSDGNVNGNNLSRGVRPVVINPSGI